MAFYVFKFNGNRNHMQTDTKQIFYSKIFITKI